MTTFGAYLTQKRRQPFSSVHLLVRQILICSLRHQYAGRLKMYLFSCQENTTETCLSQNRSEQPFVRAALINENLSPQHRLLFQNSLDNRLCFKAFASSSNHRSSDIWYSESVNYQNINENSGFASKPFLATWN